MENYMYRRNKDGLHCIDLAKTWEKAMVAARIIAAIQDKNNKDVLVSAQTDYLGGSCSAAQTSVSRNALIRLTPPNRVTVDRVQPPIRPESRAQVRHLHRR
jgi:hypothetical protein